MHEKSSVREPRSGMSRKFLQTASVSVGSDYLSVRRDAEADSVTRPDERLVRTDNHIMADVVRCSPGFKGVVVSTCLLAVLLSILISTAEASALTVGSSSVTDRDGKSLAAAEDDSSSSAPYCVYLDQSQELDCVCGDQDGSLVFPYEVSTGGEGEFLVAADKSVASVKLHSCKSASLRLDLTALSRPFYRLRIEDVETVRVDGIKLLPNDTVDVWVRNVNGSLTVRGDMSCDGCSKMNVAKNASESSSVPNLMLHLVEIGDLEIDNVVVGDDVNAKIKVRNVSGGLRIVDSYFKSVPRNGLEVFNVGGDGVVVEHSEFHNASSGSVLLNGVRTVRVRDSLLDRAAVDVLSDGAVVEWRCSVSPLVSPADVLTPEELANCTLPAGKRNLFGVGVGGGVESGGAIVLAVVSASLFIVALAVLAVLHRTGKLEQYL